MRSLAHCWTKIRGHRLGPAPIFALTLVLLTGTQLLAVHAEHRSQDQSRAPAYIGSIPEPQLTIDPDLDASVRLLYQLKFVDAREGFRRWEQQHPIDALGPALEAAADLYEQFLKQGVLSSDFFLDDNRLLGGITGKPDAELEASFASAAMRADAIAHTNLASRPRDLDSLFALTLTAGMRSDNAALIEKRQLEGLHYLREADRDAHALLAVAPDTEDGYLALGAANYIVGCMPAYKRAFLWVGGVHGDKVAGMQQLSRAAAGAHYLRPFAKLLLALAALREKQPTIARQQFAELAVEFPDNPLFAKELAKASASSIPASTGAHP